MGRQVRRARHAADRLDGLAALFGGYFGGPLAPAQRGAGSRRRRFPRVDVFWAFLSQILHRGDSCRHALRRLQALAISRGEEPGGDDTSPYCQARARLGLGWLESLLEALGRLFLPESPETPTWYGRTTRLIDGTCFSMPDTPKNRAVYDQPGCQKPGCGFPVGKSQRRGPYDKTMRLDCPVRLLVFEPEQALAGRVGVFLADGWGGAAGETAGEGRVVGGELAAEPGGVVHRGSAIVRLAAGADAGSLGDGRVMPSVNCRKRGLAPGRRSQRSCAR